MWYSLNPWFFLFTKIRVLLKTTLTIRIIWIWKTKDIHQLTKLFITFCPWSPSKLLKRYYEKIGKIFSVFFVIRLLVRNFHYHLMVISFRLKIYETHKMNILLLIEFSPYARVINQTHDHFFKGFKSCSTWIN